jgi:hypothetical protein
MDSKEKEIKQINLYRCFVGTTLRTCSNTLIEIEVMAESFHEAELKAIEVGTILFENTTSNKIIVDQVAFQRQIWI